MYADDVSLFVLSNDMDSALCRLQKAIDKYSNWLTDIGFSLNPLKSKYMIFTRKKITVPPILKLKNFEIPRVSVHKFLGPTLDAPYLTWRKHIDKLLVDCNKRLNVMISICCSNWGCSRSVLKKLYISFIKSKIYYGIHIYSPASASQLHKLEVVQNKAVRIITGLRRGTQSLSLNYEVRLVS